VINNVITLASVPIILARAGNTTRISDGSLARHAAVSAGGNIKRGGLVEKAFGLTLRELLYDLRRRLASGRPIRAVQVGGPLGRVPAGVAVRYCRSTTRRSRRAAGCSGTAAWWCSTTVDMASMARYAMEFCAIESCGKCTPCRIGSTRGVEVIDRIRAGERRGANLVLLRDLCDTMVHGSLCAMGG
jgi:formate dehydrogenase iron-sulfur subunit